MDSQSLEGVELKSVHVCRVKYYELALYKNQDLILLNGLLFQLASTNAASVVVRCGAASPFLRFFWYWWERPSRNVK
jgi:hypothetical protein